VREDRSFDGGVGGTGGELNSIVKYTIIYVIDDELCIYFDSMLLHYGDHDSRYFRNKITYAVKNVMKFNVLLSYTI